MKNLILILCLLVSVKVFAQTQAFRDLSPIFQTDSVPYSGTFGEDVQPIRLYFSKVSTKDAGKTYSVTGYTIHRGHRSDFSGSLIPEYGTASGISQQITVRFQLTETAKHPFVGTFEGSVSTILPFQLSVSDFPKIQKNLKFISEWKSKNREPVPCEFSIPNKP